MASMFPCQQKGVESKLVNVRTQIRQGTEEGSEKMFEMKSPEEGSEKMFEMKYTDEGAESEWRGGVYLTTAKDSIEADILESKLDSEGIPCLKKYRGASNAMEIIMGSNNAYPIDIYVPENTLEDAKNIITAVPISDEELEEAAISAVPEEDE